VIRILAGDCRDVMRTMPDCSVDSIVTDPPYGLEFMGKEWDKGVPGVDVWRECLRVLKPGGHLLAFAGTRTQHRMCTAIEDAGFEIRDMIAWVYGSGFPKSLDVSKAIDKAAGAVRSEVVGTKLGRPGMAKDGRNQSFDGSVNTYGAGGVLSSDITAPATEAARQWQGWGTALKPAMEPITVARKPLAGTVAATVLAHGTGALNIEACRVPGEESTVRPINNIRVHGGRDGAYVGLVGQRPTDGRVGGSDAGRWPANVIHDGSDEVVARFPETASGSRKAGAYNVAAGQGRYGDFGVGQMPAIDGDSGSAARFFYTAKADSTDRGAGNNHPTVKPTDLMRYLVRLVTPPGGTVLDPFAGSGSTLLAADREQFDAIGIELDPRYVAIARERLRADMPLFAEP
jgi:site-specific DNA-methyltransferase (adenine-specific)